MRYFKNALSFSLAMIFLGQYACAEDTALKSLRELLSTGKQVKVGMSLEEVKKLHPNLTELKNPGKKSENTAVVYLESVKSPVFESSVYSFSEGKIEGLTLMTPWLMKDNWEVAAAIVQYGNNIYQIMNEFYDKPVKSMSSDTASGGRSLYFEWKIEGFDVVLTMSAPESLMRLGKNKRNPLGIIMVSFRKEGMPQYPVKMFDKPFDLKYLESDFDLFMKDLSVIEKPDTEKYFPEGLKGLYLGMPMDNIKKIRSELKADDFYNERSDYRDKYRDECLSGVGYSARKDVKKESESRAKLAAQLKNKMGVPSGYYVRKEKDGEVRASFVWRVDGAKVVLARYPGKRKGVVENGYTLDIAEEKLEIEDIFAGFAQVQTGKDAGYDLEEEWAKLLSGKW